MAVTIKDLRFSIYLNNADAKKSAIEMQTEIQKVGDKMSELAKSGQKDSQAYRDLKKTQDELKVSFEKTKLEAGLLGMSIKELRKLSVTMKGDLSRMVPDSDDWKKLEKDIKVVDGRIGDLKGTAKSTEGSLSKMANGFNKYFAMGTAFVATITGMSFAFRSMAEDVAKMDDVYSDVMKTTNLTKDQVLGLNEEFKKMDTRTSRDSLNLLARDAGKLGIEGTQNILDFVDAGNQINVALGEDLGDDAIKNIGKMVGVYKKSTKELQDLGLKEQMLAVGSAINDLGAASSADEGYLVEFAGRMGGVATQAKLGMDAVLGFGSVMDQNMQQVEMSSSALSKFIMKMMGDPAKFAKLAGLEVKGFTKLLDTDANAAIKKVLVALNDKGGFKALVPIFEDMQMDGVRATQVLATLASNITELDAAQKVANKSMIAGTSVTKEYGIKNDNLAARLDKSKKAFTEVSLQLGENLNPVLLKSTNLLTYMVRGLVTIIPYLGTIGKFMLIVAGYTAAYNGNLLLNNFLLKEGIGIKIKDLFLKAKDAIVLEGLIVKEAIHAATIGKTTAATKAAAIVQVLWNNAVKANPLGLALGILTTIAGAIWLVTSRMGEATEAQKAQINIQKKVSEQYGDQESKVAMLVGVLNNEKIALGERKKALDELKAIVPGYHADLTAEGKLINNNTSAVKDYLVQLEKEIRMQAAKDELIELYRKKRLQEKEVKAKEANATNAEKGATLDIIGEPVNARAARGLLAGQQRGFANEAKTILGDIDEAIKLMETEVSSASISKPSTGPKKGDKKLIDDMWCTWDGSKWVPDKVGGGGGTGDGGDPNKEKLKALDAAMLAEQVALKKANKSKEDTDAGMLELDVKYLTKKRNLYKKDSAEYNAFESQLLDTEKKKKMDANEALLESIKDSHKAISDATDSYEQQKREDLQAALDDGTKTQEQYNAELVASDVALAERRLKSAEDYQVLISNATYNSKEDKQKAVEAATGAVTSAKKVLLKAQKAVTKNKLDDEKKHLEDVAKIRKELGLDKEKLSYKEGLKALKDKLKLSKASEKEAASSIAKYKISKAQEYAQEAVKLVNTVGDFVSASHQAEADSLAAAKEKELTAAGDNAEKRQAIEADYAQKELDLKKKQADANMAIQIAQAMANGALGIAEIWAKEGVNPIYAGILTALLVGITAANIGSAVAQRDAIKNTSLGKYDGGYTGGTNPREVRGTLSNGEPVHGQEFVANHKAVRNPQVKKFLDVFNTAQMNGTIHMLNTTQILEKVRATPSAGYQAGGYVQSPSGASGSVNSDVAMALVNENTKAMNRLNGHLDSGIVARSVIAGDNGSYKKTEDYKKMRANVSRG